MRALFVLLTVAWLLPACAGEGLHTVSCTPGDITVCACDDGSTGRATCMGGELEPECVCPPLDHSSSPRACYLENEGCICSTRTDERYTVPHCNEWNVRSLTEPGLCCTAGDWPSSGFCSCETVVCRRASTVNGPMCICGRTIFSLPEDDVVVDACAAPAGGACCRDSLGECSCRTYACDPDQTTVASCGLGDVDCGTSAMVHVCSP